MEITSPTPGAAKVHRQFKVVGLAKVSILDGGFATCKAADNAIKAGASTPSPKIITAALDKRMLVETAEVEKIEPSGGVRPAFLWTFIRSSLGI
jgi:3-mercaptopyruvate sulfurtransferase SseA